MILKIPDDINMDYGRCIWYREGNNEAACIELTEDYVFIRLLLRNSGMK